MFYKVGLKGFPVQILELSYPFALEDLVCTMSCSVRLEKGEGPVDTGLVVQKIVTTD